MSPGCLFISRAFCVLIRPWHPCMPPGGTLPATICLTWGLTTELLPRNMLRSRPHVINSRLPSKKCGFILSIFNRLQVLTYFPQFVIIFMKLRWIYEEN